MDGAQSQVKPDSILLKQKRGNLSGKSLQWRDEASFTELGEPRNLAEYAETADKTSAQRSSATPPDHARSQVIQSGDEHILNESIRGEIGTGPISDEDHKFSENVRVHSSPESVALPHGLKFDAQRAIDALLDKSRGPYDLLAALSNQLSTHGSRTTIHLGFAECLLKNYRNLTPEAANLVKNRLQGPQIGALKEQLENFDTSGVRNAGAVKNFLCELAHELGELPVRLGITDELAAAEPGTKQDHFFARAAVEQFVRECEVNYVACSGSVAVHDNMGGFLPPGLSDRILLGGQPCESVPGISDFFLDELGRSKYVLEHPDGTREFLADMRVFQTDDQNLRDELIMQAAVKLEAFCLMHKGKARETNRAAMNFAQNPHGKILSATEKNRELDKIYSSMRGHIGAVAVISVIANREGMGVNDELRSNMHEQSFLPLPRAKSGRADSEGRQDQERVRLSESDIAYVIKANGDGTFRITQHSESQVTHKTDRSGANASVMNPGLSHWNTATICEIDAASKASLTRIDYDYSVMPYLAASAISQACSVEVAEPARSLSNWAVKLKVPVMPEFCEVGYESERVGRMARADADLVLTGQAKQLAKLRKLYAQRSVFFNDLEKDNIELCLEVMEDTMQFIAGAQHSVAEAEKFCAAFVDIHVTILAWLGSFAEMADNAFVDKNQTAIQERMYFYKTITQALAYEMGKTEDVVNAYQSARDDMRATIDAETITAHGLFRSENARIQSEAVLGAVEEILARQKGPATGSGAREQAAVKLGEQANAGNDNLPLVEKLRDKMLRRCEKIKENSRDSVDGKADLLQYGTGAGGKKRTRAAAAVSKDLAAGKELPDAHDLLSEAQLAKIEIDHWIRQYPGLKSEFADFAQLYEQNFNRRLGERSWLTITHTFHDRIYRSGTAKPDDKYKRLTSKIIPALRFPENNFANSYYCRSVPCGDRTQVKHVNNLALSELTDKDGKLIFSGLRHGVLDAYDLSVAKMASIPVERKHQVLDDTSKVRLENKGSIALAGANDRKSELELFNSGKGLDYLRGMASRNMAEELVAAAVVTNPRMLDKARYGKEINLKLDSLALVTPELAGRFRNPAKSERKLLKNQREALASLNGKTLTVRVQIEKGGIFHRVDAKVNVQVRTYNFAVGSYAMRAFKFFLKPFMGWGRSDRMNKPALTELVGPSRENIGGDAKKMADYLRGLEEHGLSADEIEDIEVHRGNLPYDNPVLHAEAIETCARQIKQMLRSKSHHGSEEEPCQLATRVAMLSHLLGRTAAFSCRSGNDRSSVMDAEVKLMAANAAEGYFPEPGTQTDLVRKTNFALRTGNLELQEYNTGLRGYNLAQLPALLKKLNNSLAKKILTGG